MKEAKRQFKRFQDDLDYEISKSKRFQLGFEIELAKLKIAHKLAETREKIGLTQVELAIKMNVSQQLVSRIESGSENLTLETLTKILTSLQLALKIQAHKRKNREDIVELVKF